MSPVVTIDGKKLKLSNLSKVLYPDSGFTKGQVIDYYGRVADYILPHLHNRPVTMRRFPEGVKGESFYQKQCPPFKPEWLKTSDKNSAIAKNFCLINDLPSLIWVQNLASIELHTLLATVEDLNCPTQLVFDLDAGEPASLLDCLEIALIIRDMLEGLGLKCFPKTTGGKGLHFYLPLNTPVTYEQTKRFARIVAQLMQKHYPDKVTSKMAKTARQGKVFVDWSQNTFHKTTACVYSLRARDEPTVSMPATWKDLELAFKRGKPENLIYTAQEAVKKLQKDGDIFKEVLTIRQHLPMEPGKKKQAKSRKLVEQDSDSLRQYRKKRDFAQTPEPSGVKTRAAEHRSFVIHRHTSRKLHYDLRIESKGVLISWAVPKGPSSDPSQKRLAVRTEDHPLEYKDFEGTIPEGHYGAGEVIIWDSGTYINMTRNSKRQTIPVDQAIAKGKLEIFFNGNKIRGTYVLVRMKTADEKKENWLLIKSKDKYISTLPDNLEVPR